MKYKVILFLIIIIVLIYNPFSARFFTWNIALLHRIDTTIFYRLIKAESSFQSLAISHQKAIGLGQLKASTFKYMKPNLPEILVWFPLTNLDASACYIKYLQKKFNNNWSLTLAAYNWGESNIDKRFANKPIVSEKDYRYVFQDIPETYEFIKKILGDSDE
jgi:soluble lytic murein transglycosylase